MLIFFRLFLCFVMLLVMPFTAQADDERMAGKIPVSSVRHTDQKPAKKPPVRRADDDRTVATRKKSAPPAEKASAGEMRITKKTVTEAPPPAAEELPPDTAAASDDIPPGATILGPAPTTGDITPAAATAAAEATPLAETPQPRTGRIMQRDAMESLGPLSNPLDGGLGQDMWSGSKRSTLMEYIPLLPEGATWRSAQTLARRVLVSNGDANMLRNDISPVPGGDLFTIRLEKLLRMGAYQDAYDLYTMMQGEPPHERVAHAGIIAMLSTGHSAQACLEARVTRHDKNVAPDQFWDQMDAICLYVQSQAARKVSDPGLRASSRRGADSSAVTGVPGSKLLTTLVSRSDYRHTVTSPDDITELNEMERAVLRGLGRFDYSRLRLKKLYEIPSPVLMLMATDANLPVHHRITLNVEATARGLIDPADLGDIYISAAEHDDGAPAITHQYAAATKAEKGAARNTAVAEALDIKGRGLPVPLLPFAPMVSDLDPASLPPRAVETGLLLMLYAGIVPPESWVTTWLKTESGDSKKTPEQVYLYLANILPENLPTNSISFADDQMAPYLNPSDSAQALEIYALFSGLRRQDALHNPSSQELYEKELDLTLVNDYVMPSEGLIEKLHEAAENTRLGEVALLTSVALNEYQPGKTHPGVLREVLRSLETVGLKEEAQTLALEVLLGLKQ